MLIVVMGAESASKTVGQALARRLGYAFQDAADHQPAENREKLARGETLGDADSWPWLESLARLVPRWEATDGVVLGCSALKKAYRDVLLKNSRQARIVYLAEGDTAREALSTDGVMLVPASM